MLARRGFVTVRSQRQDGVHCPVISMLGSLAYLFDDVFLGTMVAVAFVVGGFLVWRRLWKHREQRRESRERLRRQF